MTAPSTQPQVIAPRTRARPVRRSGGAHRGARAAFAMDRAAARSGRDLPGGARHGSRRLVGSARPRDARPRRTGRGQERAGGRSRQRHRPGAGWLEPAPYPHYASALADGIVDEVLVLEGQRVEAGQPVARLIDDDAQRLGLAQAQASLELQQAELEGTKATLQAAERSIETLIAPRRAALSSEARVAEVDAGLARLAADLLVEEAKLAEIEDELRRKSELLESRAVSEADLRRLQLARGAEGGRGVHESGVRGPAGAAPTGRCRPRCGSAESRTAHRGAASAADRTGRGPEGGGGRSPGGGGTRRGRAAAGSHGGSGAGGRRRDDSAGVARLPRRE